MRVLLIISALWILASCSTPAPKVAFADLPMGDAERGAQLFTQSINGGDACSGCHLIEGNGGTYPSMAGFGDRAGNRVEGLSAAEYAYESIVRPAKFIVAGYSNLMSSHYGQLLDAQQLADLIAYLLSL